MRALRLMVLCVGLWLAYVVLFVAGAAVLGPVTNADPAEAGAALGGLAAVAAIDVAIVGAWLARTELRGWRLWLVAAAVLYGVKTFSSQLETWYFVDAAHVPPEMVPRLFTMTLPLAILWPGLAAWALAPRGPTSPVRWDGAAAARGALAGALVYPVLFFLAGYYIAWQSAEVRAYYAGPEVALPFLQHFSGMFAADPAVVPFEMARGLLWVALGWPVYRLTRGHWLVGTVLFALMMALVQNDLHLLPNPLMPPGVRWWHFVETSSSNFVFALLTGAFIAAPWSRESARTAAGAGSAGRSPPRV